MIENVLFLYDMDEMFEIFVFVHFCPMFWDRLLPAVVASLIVSVEVLRHRWGGRRSTIVGDEDTVYTWRCLIDGWGCLDHMRTQTHTVRTDAHMHEHTRQVFFSSKKKVERRSGCRWQAGVFWHF